MNFRKRSSSSRSKYSGPHEARRKSVEKKKLLSTLFFDPLTMRELGLDDCARQMFEHAGLGNFYYRSAPTFPEWTREFLITLDDEPDQGRITFQLAGRTHVLGYDELDAALGITKQPSPAVDWVEATEQLIFWCRSTGAGTFDPKSGEYNYKWSHPCLRLAHKVIRMAWFGQSEMNKVPHLDLEAVWSMTPGCTLVRDWRSLFLACCKKYQLDKTCKITVGGMVSLLAVYMGIDFPDQSERLTSGYTYDFRQLKQVGVLSEIRGRRHYLYGSKGCYQIPLPLAIEMPFGPRYSDFDLSRFRVGSAGAGSSSAPPAVVEEDIEEEDADMQEAEYEAEPTVGDWDIQAAEYETHYADQPTGWGTSDWGSVPSSYDMGAGTSGGGTGMSWQDDMMREMSRLSVRQDSMATQQTELASSMERMHQYQQQQAQFFQTMWPGYPSYPDYPPYPPPSSEQ